MSGLDDSQPIDRIDNPPGLAEAAYAHARHAGQRAAMLGAIARDTRYLRDLNSRDPADPTLALIDSWAMAGDVLSFYAERIANESWLPTATERRSLRSLVRLIDYELRPGKAAETWLAFTLEDAPGAPLEVAIPVGTRVRSIPGPGEGMVTFETLEAITGRPHLSAMRPRREREQSLADVAAAQAALCQGVLNDVRRGDWLLLAQGARTLLRAESVQVDPPAGNTRITLGAQPVTPPISLPLSMAYHALAPGLAARTLAPALVSEVIAGKRVAQTAFEGELRAARIDTAQLAHHLRLRPVVGAPPPGQDGLFHFRSRAAIFGHNVPNEAELGKPPQPASPSLHEGQTVVSLDAEYAELRPGSWIAFVQPSGEHFITQVTRVATASVRHGRLTGRVTQVTLGQAISPAWSGQRADSIVVLVDSRRLPLAPLPVTEDVAGSTLRFDRFLPGLGAGRPVIVSGERADMPGVIANELHTIADVQLDDGYTVIELGSTLSVPLARGSVRVNANVARASHGETGGQPIGHGNAALASQTFRLPVAPLAHLGAPNARGLAAELQVWVDGVSWSEVPALRDAGPTDRVYQLRYGEDDAVWVCFGDGVNGRRLPTGVNNVMAVWRKGGGREGMVRAGQLSLLSGAPQGVKSVTNPLPATGAADPETLEQTRASAPLSVLTLGRIVTLQDYEDFARAFGGISQARAVWSWNGTSRAIALTVVGIAGEPPSARDIENLRGAIGRASDGAIALAILPHRPAWFRVAGALHVTPGQAPESVLAAAEAALRDEFSVERRRLGQPVFRSEVMATLQAVPGVDWLDLDALYRGEAPTLAESLFAEAPRSGLRLGRGAAPIAAELLTLHPGPLGLRVAS